MTKPHRMFLTVALLAVIVGVAEMHQSEDTHTISQISTNQKVVALTIDDGPHYKITPEILTVLKEKQVKATFFVLGVNAQQSPAILAQEVADGHEIGMHTYSHPILTKLSPQKILDEFDKAEKALLPIAPKPTLFRPPGGIYNSRVLEIAQQRGYTTILWSIDPHDWSRPPSEKVVDRVLADITPGSIVLLHDGQYPLPTAQALRTIIDRLRKLGYEFVTISELLQYNEVRHSLDWFR
ncbi:polysaccharide deacetylase [Anaerosporomusa subterranea]|uniref:Polysaccharide deacetylase n=1 Tax=Anaerosporomusa subterranea TaxID=1794912 RepID=A0A154BPB1_ANASB|nr:polysaccharide deacetylase family protein [Anaerosporomusa subterranea]KYZ75348.1 polysaccharide deacetylase [Anaerosporomusa subterranea]